MMTTSHPIPFLLGLTVVGALSASAPGATLVESFDYADGASLDGAGAAGGGWGGGWALTGATTGTATATAPGLTYAGVAAAGNKATIDTDTQSLNLARPFASTLGGEGTTTYVSFVIERTGTSVRFMGLSLDGAISDLLIGHGSGSANWGISVGATAANSSVPTTTQSLLVVRIDAVAGADTATLWVNPDLSLTESGNVSAGQITTIDFGAFSRVILQASATSLAANVNNDFVFDELRISDVSPFAVPEPASAMLALAAAPLLARRRR